MDAAESDVGSVYGEEVFSAETGTSDGDQARAFAPSVVEDDDGRMLMWYSGHDGTTSRIFSAECDPRGAWRRRGVAVDAGLAGDTDAFGVESPSVVRTRGGYLMAYAGSDGADTRLHMATSTDGQRWEPHGPFMQRGEADSVGATHPCLVSTGRGWWLFYAGYDGADNGRRATVMAAVSATGASWDRVGVVLDPQDDELAVVEPWVVLVHRKFHMLYVSDDGASSSIHMATSDDGVSWQRRGAVLAGSARRAVRSPCVVRLADGRFRLWYAARPVGTTETDGERLWWAQLSARL